jgi:L-fuculose-phosphate aldolase
MSDPRADLVDTAVGMAAAGLANGTSGNLSVRAGEGFWITPSGMAYERLRPEDVPYVRLDGSCEHRLVPSSEWRIHRDVYLARPRVQAVLHAHPPFGVALACVRRDVPAFHYMVARFGGDSVRCSGYATYGTQELSDAALAALEGRSACLLANHGVLVCGSDLERALASAVELEDLCAQYARACQLGDPVLLSREEMAAVLDRFAGYGQGRPSGPGRAGDPRDPPGSEG